MNENKTEGINSIGKSHQDGFGIIAVLLAVLVVALIAGCTAYAWSRHHSTASSSAKSSTSEGNAATRTGTGSQSSGTNDPYAGWESYCDSSHSYCFKYPSDWTLSGSGGQVSLLSPSQTVQLEYANPSEKDSALVQFMPTTVSSLPAGSQELSLVGGYVPSSGDNGLAGNDIPVYEITDTSALTTWPLTAGKIASFPSNPTFTDSQASGSSNGSFVAKPAVTINSVADADSWLESADAKTGVLILESLAPSG